MEIWIPVLVAVITGGLGLVGSLAAGRRQSTLTIAEMDKRQSVYETKISGQIENLRDQVEKHNNVIERTFRLEQNTALQDAELKRLNKRLEIIENK